MKYTNFKDIKISKLGFGVMRLPLIEGGGEADIDYEKAEALVDYAYEQGVNYYDTAYIYHGEQSEEFIGKALSKYPRDSYYVADKFNLQANPNYREQFELQLKRLNLDRIDFYMLHGVQDPNLATVSENGCIPYFDSLKAEGKIKYFGFSFHGSPDGFKQLLSMYDWDFVMIQLNYYDWAYGEAKELYKLAEEKNIPLMIMEPVRGGKLATLTPEASQLLNEVEPSRSIASWAMRWLMDLPQIAVVLSGMSTLEQVKDNVSTFTEFKALDDSEKKTLHEACELFRPTVAAACTDCRYCIADCPKELDIPRLLKVYNDIKIDHMWRIVLLGNLPKSQQPENCTACGICVKQCPQDLDIPKYMTELVKWSNEKDK